jgi:nitrile hydratase subunit beta
MSRIHDMGGRFGDGTIPDKDDAVVFHADWHAKAMATTIACGALGAWSIDASRHARECLVPAEYARFSYYEKWMAALADLLVGRNLLTRADLERAAQVAEARAPAKTGTGLSDKALRGEAVAQAMRTVAPYVRNTGPAAIFDVGDRVRTASYNPNRRVPGGHTRLPGYAMGRVGTVVMLHGNHVLPDSNAHFAGEAPEPLYAVEFSASDLWDGDAEDTGDCMVLDLWQSYLEPETA